MGRLGGAGVGGELVYLKSGKKIKKRSNSKLLEGHVGDQKSKVERRWGQQDVSSDKDKK